MTVQAVDTTGFAVKVLEDPAAMATENLKQSGMVEELFTEHEDLLRELSGVHTEALDNVLDAGVENGIFKVTDFESPDENVRERIKYIASISWTMLPHISGHIADLAEVLNESNQNIDRQQAYYQAYLINQAIWQFITGYTLEHFSKRNASQLQLQEDLENGDQEAQTRALFQIFGMPADPAAEQAKQLANGQPIPEAASAEVEADGFTTEHPVLSAPDAPIGEGRDVAGMDVVSRQPSVQQG